MGTRVKDFDSTGVAPNGELYAGDLNSIQDQYADLVNLAQALSVASVAIGESGLQLLRYGSGEARLSGLLRVDGILRGLGGLYGGSFTTTQRDAIASGSRPKGLVIFNSDNNRYEYNSGTDTTPNWQPIGTATSSINQTGLLSARPSASSAGAGTKYFATDQVVEYISDGTNWIRTGIPAGAEMGWYNNTVPAGWIAYDGGNLPSSTGIYADLYAHLGGLATPDTRGRVEVGLGSHADVNAIKNNDGVSAAYRRPKHRTTDAKTVSRTADVTIARTISAAISRTVNAVVNRIADVLLNDPSHTHGLSDGGSVASLAGGSTWYPAGGASTADAASIGAATTGISVSQQPNFDVGTQPDFAVSTQPDFGVTQQPDFALGGSIGTNNGNDVLDAPAYIVHKKIAKL